MNPYVGVTNDASLAVKSVLQMKKAFWTQMKCIDDMSNQNKSLQQTISQLEVRNKELCTLVAVLTQNKKLKNKVTKLESDNEKQEHIVSDFIHQSNVDIDDINPISPTSPVGSNPERKVQQVCPSSPEILSRKVSKRKSTPEKKTRSRKSPRVSKDTLTGSR